MCLSYDGAAFLYTVAWFYAVVSRRFGGIFGMWTSGIELPANNVRGSDIK